jgi:hypothetical protein
MARPDKPPQGRLMDGFLNNDNSVNVGPGLIRAGDCYKGRMSAMCRAHHGVGVAMRESERRLIS